jgi:hypothetical protein
MISGKPIDLARNVMVTKKALQDKCEFIFFLDSEILVFWSRAPCSNLLSKAQRQISVYSLLSSEGKKGQEILLDAGSLRPFRMISRDSSLREAFRSCLPPTWN